MYNLKKIRRNHNVLFHSGCIFMKHQLADVIPSSSVGLDEALLDNGGVTLKLEHYT